MQSWRGLPRQAQVALAVLGLAAVIGWILYGSTRTELGSTRASGQALAEQVAELEATLGKEREARGDLAAIEAQVADAQSAFDDATARFEARLEELDTKEQELAAADLELGRTIDQLPSVQAELAVLTGHADERRHELVTAEQTLAGLKQEETASQRDLAAAQSTLAESRSALAEVHQRLGRARALEAIDSLKAQQTDLTSMVAALDHEIARRSPLLKDAIALDGKVIGLEEKLVRLTAVRNEHVTVIARVLALRDQLRQATAADEARWEAKRQQFAAEQAASEAALAALAERKAAADIELHALDGAIENKRLVFETLARLHDEQAFLSDVMAETIAQGNEARSIVTTLRAEVVELEQRRVRLVTEVSERQTEIETLKGSVSERSQTVGNPGD